METKAEFKIGDLVSHKKRGYTGVVVEILNNDLHEYNNTPIYKINWEHGEWMYEIEEQLKLEVHARNI